MVTFVRRSHEKLIDIDGRVVYVERLVGLNSSKAAT